MTNEISELAKGITQYLQDQEASREEGIAALEMAKLNLWMEWAMEASKGMMQEALR